MVSRDSEEPEGNKYALLDRLFAFVDVGADQELNSVLSSYFCKLVTILIRRNPRELTQYIFRPNSTIIDNLLKHSYQKAISDLLLWVLVRTGTSTDQEVCAFIKQAQNQAIFKLVGTLGPDYSEEYNLNA